MMLWVETLAVGIYSMSIAYILTKITYMDNLTLYFTSGFFKHLLGGLFQIHRMYCGWETYHNQAFIHLFGESIAEGFAFVCLGLALRYLLGIIGLIPNKYMVMFGSGVLLHMIAELTGLHGWFCKKELRSFFQPP